jgi:hypothetical protein
MFARGIVVGVVLLVSLALSACGSASQKTSTPNATTSKTPNATTSKTATGSTGSAATTDTGKSDAIKALAVSACRSRIQSEPALTSTEKSRLEKVCNKAAEGASASREVARKVCVEVIKHSALPGSPENPARKRALAACKNAK